MKESVDCKDLPNLITFNSMGFSFYDVYVLTLESRMKYDILI